MPEKLRAYARKYQDVALGAVGVCALVLFWWMQLDHVGTSATFFACSANDGCFQMFNPLRRLAAGQRIGRDFMFFYGPGSILLHYPLFRAYGSDLLASEAARVLVTPPLFMAATFAFLRVLVKRTGASIFLTGLACWFGYRWFMTVVIGHNSLFGLRAAIPVAAAALLLYAFRDKTRLGLIGLKPPLAVIGLGAMAAAALFVSPDQGSAMTLAMTVVLLLMSDRTADKLKNTAWFLTTAAFGTLALYGLMAGPDLVETLRFHFIEAPGDQTWYFGVPPHPFIYSWQGVSRHLGLVITAEAAVVLGLLTLGIRDRLGRDRASAVAYLCGYGILSCIGILGYLKPAYLDALRWCLLLCAAVFGVALLEKARAALDTRRGLLPTVSRVAFPVAAVIVSLYVIYTGIMTVRISEGFDDIIAGMQARSEKTAFEGVTLDKDWSEHRDMVYRYLNEKQAIGDAALPLWSTYSSTMEAELGIFNPDTDYIIHTLGGDRRAEYAQSFADARPPVVVTTDPVLLFNEWLWQSHWNFFEQVATGYDYQDRSWKGAVWTRRGQTGPEGPWTSTWLTDGGSRAIMRFPDADERNIWTVRLQYEVTNPWAALPVIGGMPRFLVWAKGGYNPLPMSLPPDRHEILFPVFTEGDSPIWLETDVKSLLPGAGLRIIRAEFRKSPVPEDNLAYFFRRYRLECGELNGFIRCWNLIPQPPAGEDTGENPHMAGWDGDTEI